jgi:hypothetical protein
VKQKKIISLKDYFSKYRQNYLSRKKYCKKHSKMYDKLSKSENEIFISVKSRYLFKFAWILTAYDYEKWT